MVDLYCDVPLITLLPEFHTCNRVVGNILHWLLTCKSADNEGERETD